MVGGIGSSGGGALDGIRAALQRQAEATKRLAEAQANLTEGSADVAPDKADFGDKLRQGLEQVNSQVQLGDELVDGILTGKVTEFHEVASQVKQADLTFKFALSVRNKFIDAYREVMRMSV